MTYSYVTHLYVPEVEWQRGRPVTSYRAMTFIATSYMTWLSHVSHGSFICDVTHSNETCLIPMWHVPWPPIVPWRLLQLHMWRALLMSDTTHSYVWHASFICDMTHSYVWHDSFICVTWLIHMCDMTHSYVTWRIHMWCASFLCDIPDLQYSNEEGRDSVMCHDV